MKPLSLGELSGIFGAELRANSDALVRGFATDSGQVQPGDLFLAIKGARVDGHDFASQAIAKGAVAVLAERPVDAPQLMVPSLVDALAKLGKHFRAQFDGPVVGITGSAGKTTTKEFVASALSPLGKVLKSEGNRNTEYTSPLLWAELEFDTKAVAVEMAMRGFGQIRHLAEVARPNVGIVTNIGYAHLMQMGSRERIAKAKRELLEALPPSGVAVLWNECPYLGLLQEATAAHTIKTFGFNEGAYCRLTKYQIKDLSSASVEGYCGHEFWSTTLNGVGHYVALDAAAAILTAHVCGVSIEEAAAAIASTQLPPLRMEVRSINGATLLLDNYNASPPSMISAIETLLEMPVSGRRYAVIGEMRELGDHTESSHREVGRALKKGRLERVLFVGEATKYAKDELGTASSTTAESLADVTDFLRHLKPGDAVLVKGSRALELEKAVEGLEDDSEHLLASQSGKGVLDRLLRVGPRRLSGFEHADSNEELANGQSVRA